jgi:hypothetical protein
MKLRSHGRGGAAYHRGLRPSARRHRATFDAGGDPTVIVAWIQDIQGERLAAEPVLGQTVPQER